MPGQHILRIIRRVADSPARDNGVVASFQAFNFGTMNDSRGRFVGVNGRVTRVKIGELRLLTAT